MYVSSVLNKKLYEDFSKTTWLPRTSKGLLLPPSILCEDLPSARPVVESVDRC
nr:MAG: 5.9 kDa unknown protein [Ophiovirus ranunculi]UTQ50921.1 MAG: 5.9 kDa unknown protein [Ophiovirus ranunculi]